MGGWYSGSKIKYIKKYEVVTKLNENHELKLLHLSYQTMPNTNSYAKVDNFCSILSNFNVIYVLQCLSSTFSKLTENVAFWRSQIKR